MMLVKVILFLNRRITPQVIANAALFLQAIMGWKDPTAFILKPLRLKNSQVEISSISNKLA